MSDDLIAFLRARLDEDADVARRGISSQEDWEEGWGTYRPEGQRHTTIVPHVGMIHEAVQAEHVARHNPARVLAEVEAKRRIVDWHSGQRDDTTPYGVPVTICFCGYDMPCSTLRLLALPYAGHSDYREEWRL